MNRIAKSLITALLGSTLCSGLAAAQDATQAGVSAAVRGQVELARSNAVGRQIVSAEPIFLQDQISSGVDSGMQILLLDETVFTIGPESEMTIDEFVYDPATGEGSLAASMGKGVMRFVTGNISDGTPENMTIKLPVGTIGIRGTIGVAAVLSPDQAQQQFPGQAPQLNAGPGQPVIFAALAGPGPLTQTNSNTGSFNFSTPDGSVDLNRPGGAVLATPGQPPVFFIAPPGAIQQVSASLGGRGQQQQGSQQPGSQQQGGDSQSTQLSNANENSGAGKDVVLVQLESNAPSTPLPAPESPSSESTTFSDLAGIFGSSGSASASVPLSGMASAPNATASVSISFSARHMSLSGSNMPGGSFSTISGQEAQLNDSSTGASFSDSQLNCTNCSGTVAFTGGTGINVSVTEGGQTGSGSGNLN